MDPDRRAAHWLAHAADCRLAAVQLAHWPTRQVWARAGYGTWDGPTAAVFRDELGSLVRAMEAAYDELLAAASTAEERASSRLGVR